MTLEEIKELRKKNESVHSEIKNKDKNMSTENFILDELLYIPKKFRDI